MMCLEVAFYGKEYVKKKLLGLTWGNSLSFDLNMKCIWIISLMLHQLLIFTCNVTAQNTTDFDWHYMAVKRKCKLMVSILPVSTKTNNHFSPQLIEHT